VSEALPLSELCDSLKQMQPGLQVFIGDDLCNPEVLDRLISEDGLQFSVVGACRKASHRVGLGKHTEGTASRLCPPRVVDLLSEIDSSCTGSQRAERLKLLLWAQIRRAGAFEGIHEQNLKLHFAPPRDRFSRRQLFSAIIPHYEVVPHVERSKCTTSSQGCRICVLACPLDAITAEEGSVTIDKDACRACGACAVSCPNNAISYPTFSLDELDREMEGLLIPEAALLEHRAIAIVCETCVASGDEVEVLRYPHNVLPLKVPCLAMASPWLLLRAFDMGAQGVAIVSAKDMCRSGFESTTWQDNIRFVQELLARWDIEPERLRQLSLEDNDVADIETQLGEFAYEISQLALLPPEESRSTPISAKDLPLSMLISAMRSGRLQSRSAVVTDGRVPFGKVKIDESQCTGCDLCADSCPTGALAFSTDNEKATCQITFEHSRCVACGACVDICPESCIILERVLDLDRLEDPPTLLLEHETVECHVCGKNMGPASMLQKLGAQTFKNSQQVCAECAIKDELSSVLAG
jgi:ferredoxin